MTPIALITSAYLMLQTPVARAEPTSAGPVASAEVRDLKRRLKYVTAEADALWAYVTSGQENPNVAALERAANLRDLRRGRR